MSEAGAQQPVLKVRGLEKRYGRHEVLRGVDFDLFSGQIFALVGENGAGKSTLLRCVTGSEPADRGTVELHGSPLPPGAAPDRLFGVVWQDLALCDNLTVVDNIFLGDEARGGLFLDERAMLDEAQQLFHRLKLPMSDLQRPVQLLSGGQRQLVPIARAVRTNPSVLFVDEPTASLGVSETAVVERLLNDLRDGGTTIMLVSHRLDQVFRLADRIAVLRGGRITAEVSPAETHPDDVVALISGVEADSTARRQLQRLRSLVDQLADVDPGASLPLIVSAMVEALATEQICVHLLEPDGQLRCSAAVGLDPRLLAAVELLSVGEAGGPAGVAAATGRAVIVEDTRRDRRWAPIVASGLPRSSWSVPIVGSSGALGTISGWADVVRRPPEDQLELVRLYASHAASAIERERLLADATRRNRVLETLRGVLDTLAGPQAAQRGMAVALLALCRGLGADAIALHHAGGDTVELTPSPLSPADAARATARQQQAAVTLFRPAGRLDRARPVGIDVLAVPIAAPDGPAAVTAWWADPQRLTNDALDLLDDAGRSLRLALERQTFERANAEAASLRRSQRLQRDFLSRLNHELRTPLTAIQGYASTLRQPDVTWDASSQERFLDSIAAESARMGRLVGDLLDFSAIDTGTLRLVHDWCDIGLVLEAARRCINDPPATIDLGDHSDLPTVWADHDRLEQVFVNLFDNAIRHGGSLSCIEVRVRDDPAANTVTVVVADDGDGIPRDLGERIFLPHERGAAAGPGAGLGLAIARGIVDAHRGRIELLPATRGTTIAVTLPIEPPSNAAPSNAAPDQLVEPSATPPAGPPVAAPVEAATP